MPEEWGVHLECLRMCYPKYEAPSTSTDKEI